MASLPKGEGSLLMGRADPLPHDPGAGPKGEQGTVKMSGTTSHGDPQDPSLLGFPMPTPNPPSSLAAPLSPQPHALFLRLSFLKDSWRKKPGKEAVLQGSLMLKGVTWGTQNFRWILRLVCVLGALRSAHSVASPSAEKGEAGLQSSWRPVVISHIFMGRQTHIQGLMAQQQQSMNPPPRPGP